MGKSFHINLEQKQFCLVENNGEPAQKIAGSIRLLVIPNLETLQEWLEAAKEFFSNTQFAILLDMDECLTVRGPWGNQFHIYFLQHGVDNPLLAFLLSAHKEKPQKMMNLHSKGGAYGAHRMAVCWQAGIHYVKLAFPREKRLWLLLFYCKMLGCSVTKILQQNNDDSVTCCSLVWCVGPGMHLCSVKHHDDAVKAKDVQAMEGVHICFYADNFEGLYGRLLE
jgi:hypothetical protein